jgi:flagellar hook-associated protein 2
VSDISIPGVNSKYGTQTIIDGLVKVERNKLVEMQNQKKDLEDSKAVWQDTNRRMQSVRDAARTLYSFNTPFGAKMGSSSDEKSVTVSATRAASNGDYTVKVISQAAADRFLSPSLPLDQTLAPGEYRFKVGDKELPINFKGGKLQNLVDAINLKNPSLLKASLIRDTSDTQILQLEAIPVGAKNALTVSGIGLDELTKIGLLGPPQTASQSLQNGQAAVAPGTQKSWPTAAPVTVTSGMQLKLTVSMTDSPATPPPAPGFSYPDGGAVTFQSITLTGSGMEGDVPPPPPSEAPPEVKSQKGLSVKTAAGSVALPDLPDSNTPTTITLPLPAGATLTSVDLANGNSARSIVISDMQIVDPTQTGNAVPKHPLSRASDAELQFEGIDIKRDTNAVSDVIPGVTLNLQGPSTDPVKIKIEPDKKAIKDSVINFLGTYNRLITDILVLTTLRPDNPSASPLLQEASYLTDDEKKTAADRMGKMQGDIGLNQIKNTMQRIMMDPYKTGTPLSLLAQIGISTNSQGSSGDRVNQSKLRGYMEMDEPTFDAAVANNIDGVKKLFGSSLDGTLVVNSGAAYSIDELLKASTQLGGFNATKVSTIDSQIKAKDKEIADYNDYLVRYQQDLKVKYGQMEASLNAMNKNAQSLNNLGGNGQ